MKRLIFVITVFITFLSFNSFAESGIWTRQNGEYWYALSPDEYRNFKNTYGEVNEIGIWNNLPYPRSGIFRINGSYYEFDGNGYVYRNNSGHGYKSNSNGQILCKNSDKVFTASLSKGSSGGSNNDFNIIENISSEDSGLLKQLCEGLLGEFNKKGYSNTSKSLISYNELSNEYYTCCTGYVQACMDLLDKKGYGYNAHPGDDSSKWKNYFASKYQNIRDPSNIQAGDIAVKSGHVGIITANLGGTKVTIANMSQSASGEGGNYRLYDATAVAQNNGTIQFQPSRGMGSHQYTIWRKR